MKTYHLNPGRLAFLILSLICSAFSSLPAKPIIVAYIENWAHWRAQPWNFWPNTLYNKANNGLNAAQMIDYLIVGFDLINLDTTGTFFPFACPHVDEYPGVVIPCPCYPCSGTGCCPCSYWSPAAADPDQWPNNATNTFLSTTMGQALNLINRDPSSGNPGNPNLKVMIALGGWNFNVVGDCGAFNDCADGSSYGNCTAGYFSYIVDHSNGVDQTFIDGCIAYCNNNLFYASYLSTGGTIPSNIPTTSNGTPVIAGIELDWEYPGETDRGGTANDYQNFLTFMATFCEQMHTAGLVVSMTGGPYCPSSAVTGTYTDNNGITQTFTAGSDTSYVQWLANFVTHSNSAQNVDWIDVMCYDYNGTWSSVTGDNAPLYTVTGALQPEESVDNTYNLYINAGIPADKIVLGVPCYARTFGGNSLDQASSNSSIGYQQSFPSGTGEPGGTYTATPGFLAFFEVASLFGSSAATNSWINTPINFAISEYNGVKSGTAFAYYTGSPALGIPNGWVSCDVPGGPTASLNTVGAKGSYILSKGVRGALLYAVSQDIFYNGNQTPFGYFPMLSALYNGLNP